MGSFLPTLLQLLEGVPGDVAALEAIAANPAVEAFIATVEDLFHISPTTAGSATVIEPKVAPSK